MTQKAKKITNIVVDVLVGIILVLVLTLTIAIISSAGKGYTNLFGKSVMAVKTDSMQGTYSKDWEGNEKGWKKGFKPGDIIFVDILNDTEKDSLKVGDIITFYSDVLKDYNTHRIVEISDSGYIRTKGDKENAPSDSWITDKAKILGIYSSKINGLGSVTADYVVCVVVPTALVLAYCVYLVIAAAKEKNKLKLAAVKEESLANLELEKEKIRQQLLEEMKNGSLSKTTETEAKIENGKTEVKAEDGDGKESTKDGKKTK